MSQRPDPRNRTFALQQKAYKAWLDGKSFVPHTTELLASAAWRNRSIYAVRFIELLELEHASHNGSENGLLKTTWRQMRQAHIGSDYIADTIKEVEALGLVTVTHRGSYAGGARNNPSLYRLNYLPWKFQPVTGASVYYAPIDQWKGYEGNSARPKKARRMNTTSGPSRSLQWDQTAAPKIVRFPRAVAKRGDR